LEGHALTWWESHTETLRLEGEARVTKWEDFKALIKSQFYPIGYMEDQWIQWHYFRQKLGQSMQEYTTESRKMTIMLVSLQRTTEFRKMTIMLGISPKNPDVLLKYLGGLHLHLREKVMLFKPKTMDEACVQAQYLENICLKRAQSSGLKQKEQQETYKEWKKKKKWVKDKKTTTTTHQ